MNERSRHVSTTHAVENQPLPLEDYDAFALDLPLREAVEREASAVVAEVAAYGKVVGSAEFLALGMQANQHVPVLRTHDRYGFRIDEVEYHPAYHELMRRAMQHGVHNAAWREDRPGGQVAHAALLYLHTQAEAGTGCPLTMTHAAVPSLRCQPELGALFEPLIRSNDYDPRPLPVAQKRSVTLGMAMTEKQGGSDVRANTTRARPMDRTGPGAVYELTGHKWFCSAPMSDAFLTLAQAEQGLSCFLVPRFLPDGSRNRIFIQRLKDKLGNRSNASSEIEYERTHAILIGEEGRGVPTIIQMVAQTRVDCAAGSAALMRRAVTQAIHHTRGRRAFGRLLSEQPMMQRVLADLALEVEAATVLSMRVARSYDHPHDEGERMFARVATAVAKYWLTRRVPGVAFEAMECLGGAGYVEEAGLACVYREAPLNSIWEGSGNVQCLDVLRALSREPAVREALFAELRLAQGAHPTFDKHLSTLSDRLHGERVTEAEARRLVEDVALALCSALLLRHAPSYVGDTFTSTRLGNERGFEYGTIPEHVDAVQLMERAFPA